MIYPYYEMLCQKSEVERFAIMNTHRFYKLCLVACLAFLVTVFIFQKHGIGLWKDSSISERIPLTVMKESGYLVLEAHIDGRAIRMAVDTAANTTTFDIGLIEELKLVIAKNPTNTFRLDSNDVHVQAAHVKSFKVGNLSYHGDFCFINLSQPNKCILRAGDTSIEGLLGADFLTKWNAVIDYKNLCLVIRKP